MSEVDNVDASLSGRKIGHCEGSKLTYFYKLIKKGKIICIFYKNKYLQNSKKIILFEINYKSYF